MLRVVVDYTDAALSVVVKGPENRVIATHLIDLLDVVLPNDITNGTRLQEEVHRWPAETERRRRDSVRRIVIES